MVIAEESIKEEKKKTHQSGEVGIVLWTCTIEISIVNNIHFCFVVFVGKGNNDDYRIAFMISVILFSIFIYLFLILRMIISFFFLFISLYFQKTFSEINRGYSALRGNYYHHLPFLVSISSIYIFF